MTIGRIVKRRDLVKLKARLKKSMKKLRRLGINSTPNQIYFGHKNINLIFSNGNIEFKRKKMMILIGKREKPFMNKKIRKEKSKNI